MSSSKAKIFRAVVISLLTFSLVMSLFVANKCFSECNPGDCPSNPLIINSVKDLETFAQDIDAGNSYARKFVALENDISVGRRNKKLVKNLEEHGALINGTFDGNFNGNGHTITINMSDDAPQQAEKSLFKTLEKNAQVTDVTIK